MDEVHYTLARFPSGGLGLLVLLGCAAAWLAVLAMYQRDAKRLSPWRRGLMALLRLIAVSAVLLLLLEPNAVVVERKVRPGHTLLLLDASQSMAQHDAYRRAETAAVAQAWRALGISEPAAVSRIELVQQLLRSGDGELLRKLGARNAACVYSFASGLTPLPSEAHEVAQALLAKGHATDLGGALRAALDRSRGAEIAGVVLVTDGRRTSGPQAAEVARLLVQRKVPHTLVLPVGDPTETQAVAVARLELPEKVFKLDPFTAHASISTQGYGGQELEVRLVHGSGEQTVVLGKQTVTLPAGRADVSLEWPGLTLETPGRTALRAEVTPPAGEVLDRQLHGKSAVVDVVESTARVLLLAGGSSHEFQTLRTLLLRDKTIDVTCWQQNADPKFPQDGDQGMRIEALPTVEQELEPYDVVLLLDPDPSRLTAQFCSLLQKHIMDGGAGLWWVCGDRHSLAAVRPEASTAMLAELLPIEPDIEYQERNVHGFGRAFARPWPWQLSAEGDAGAAGRIVRLADAKEQNRLLWNQLPGAHFWFQARDAKPGASVLVEHSNPELLRNGKRMPMLALQHVGAGRVLWSGADETHRWVGVRPDAYQRLWVKGIRYLFEGRMAGGSRALRLFADVDQFELGEAVTLSATAKDPQGQPLLGSELELSTECDGQVGDTLRLSPVAERAGDYTLRWRPTAVGAYRVRPVARSQRSPELSFIVKPLQAERRGPTDLAELSAIAAVPGGELLRSPQELLAAVERLPSRTVVDQFRTPHALWDGWLTLVVVLVALAAEWLLRKHHNLL